MQGFIRSKKLTDVFLNLVLIAGADSFISKEEFAYLVEFGSECGFSQNDVATLLQSADTIELYVPTSEQDKRGFLMAYLKMAYMDGEMDEKEEKICKDLCNRMNLSEATYLDVKSQVEAAYRGKRLRINRVA